MRMKNNVRVREEQNIIYVNANLHFIIFTVYI